MGPLGYSGLSLLPAPAKAGAPALRRPLATPWRQPAARGRARQPVAAHSHRRTAHGLQERLASGNGSKGGSNSSAGKASSSGAMAGQEEVAGSSSAAATAAATAAAEQQQEAPSELQQEVAELRELLSQQARLLQAQRAQQEETAQVVQRQQETIQQLQAQLADVQGPTLAPAAGESDVPVREPRRPPPGPLDWVKNPSITDRRTLGSYDARFHSTSWNATPRDVRMLPRRIVLVRHAQSQGNVDDGTYTHTPDPKVSLTTIGWEQAVEAGEKLRSLFDSDGTPYRVFFYTSPYLRCKQTTEGIVQAFERRHLLGVQEEVQLREQDFGNFQDAEGKKKEKMERLRFGRFFYRFPHGESGADVYDRMTIFEDHLVRDINAGRFGQDCCLVLVTHGLAARIFLQKWFHWTVDEFLNVWNPPNAAPIVMERVTSDFESRPGGPACWIHTKALYRLTEESREHLVGCSDEMCTTSWLPRSMDSQRPHSTH